MCLFVFASKIQWEMAEPGQYSLVETSEERTKTKFPREYFLAVDRGNVYIIKGHKNLKSFISLLLIQK